MRYIIILFVITLIGLQYKLWFGDDSVRAWFDIKTKINQQKDSNKNMQAKNQSLMADIEELRHASQALEENARESLGMTKEDDVYYQIVESK